MEEPITLKAAEEFHPEFLKRKEIINYAQKQDLICYAISMINSIVIENIHKLQDQPIRCYMNTLDLITVEKEIKEAYPELTIHFPLWSKDTIEIKLVNKDWDWFGYRIKEVPKQKPTKKSFWQKLFK